MFVVAESESVFEIEIGVETLRAIACLRDCADCAWVSCRRGASCPCAGLVGAGLVLVRGLGLGTGLGLAGCVVRVRLFCRVSDAVVKKCRRVRGWRLCRVGRFERFVMGELCVARSLMLLVLGGMLGL